MLKDKFCPISQLFHRRLRRVNTQFLRVVMEEELKCQALRAQEMRMNIENPLIAEKKLQTDICAELKQLERESFLEKKRRTMLHQNEDEIRLLDVQIKRAHIQKQLVEQKALKAKTQKEQMLANAEENKRYADECRRLAEKTRQEERDIQRRKEIFRQDLLKQMKERQEIREREKGEIRKDRETMLNYIKKLKDDDEAEKKRIKCLRDTLKQEMKDYLIQNEIYQAQLRRDDETELRNQLELIRQRDEEERLKKIKRKEELLKREALSEHIGEQIFNIKKEKQKRNDQLEELLIEERLAKDDEHFKQKMQQQLQTIQKLSADLQNHLSFKENQKELEKQRKLKMLQEQLDMQQQQQLNDEQLKQLKLRKSKDYCQDLLNTTKQQRLDRENDNKELQMIYQQQLDIAAKRRQEIEAEKLRLLKKEPREIYKYIPKKAFSDDHRKELGLTCNQMIN